METKICTTCKLEKLIDEYHKDKKSKDGHHNSCKKCVSEKSKKHYIKNKEQICERVLKYRITNIEKIKIYNQKHYNEKYIKTKEYRRNNINKVKVWQKNYYLNNQIKINEKRRKSFPEYYIKNKERLVLSQKKYNEKNKDKIKDYQNKYIKNKRSTDIMYWIRSRCGISISTSLKRNGYSKKSRTYEILGCSFEDFKLHLESKFEPWMNWENRGLYNGQPNYGWDIDHIIPQSSATTEEELIKLNHFTNLQPLCSYINRYIKRDSIV